MSRMFSLRLHQVYTTLHSCYCLYYSSYVIYMHIPEGTGIYVLYYGTQYGVAKYSVAPLAPHIQWALRETNTLL